MKTRELVKELETFLRDLKEHDKLYKEFLLRLDPGKNRNLTTKKSNCPVSSADWSPSL